MKTKVPDKEGMFLQVVGIPKNRDYRTPIGIYTVEYDTFSDRAKEEFAHPGDWVYYLSDTSTGAPYILPSIEYNFLLREKYIQWIPSTN